MAATAEENPPVTAVNYKWNSSNVFHAINEGRFPADKIFDRPHYYALLDKMPVTRGHCLLISKHNVATLLDAMPPEAMADTMAELQVLTRAVQAVTGCRGVRVRQNNGPAAGQVVPQLHFHVVPVETPEDEDPSSRRPLQDEDAGPLLAALRSSLPTSHSGPGVHAWVPTAAGMEAVGQLLHSLCVPGTVLLLSGHLGSGKTAIARGIVRAFCRDPDMFVPSPTFLLNLSYQEDTAHDKQQQPGEQQQQQQQWRPGSSIHHMDPYRLGTSDKMAGLIDFEAAFVNDVSVIEWPSKMPASVMSLPRRRTIEVSIGGSGAQAAGRLLHITCTQEDQQQQQLQAGTQQPQPPAAAAAAAAGGDFGSSSSSSPGPCAALLLTWRRDGLPEPQVSWRTMTNGDGIRHESSASSLLAGSAAAGGFAAAGVAPPGPAESWLVLGIESSCDDTAAAVVRGDGTVLSHRIASQVGLHEQYGGVKPDVARDAHAAAIHETVSGAIAEAGIQPQQLSAVAVTIGPGLSLCLQVGVQHALSLATQHQLPWVPVHHMEAHALMADMPGVMDQQQQPQQQQQQQQQQRMTFPALLLLVSGGHNMLVRCEGVGRHTVLGTTIDDSMGEAFDKVARLLGITAIPGGPHLEKLAAAALQEDLARYKGKLPLPLRQDKTSCNFSFSGLKTSISKLVENERLHLQEEQADEQTVNRVNAALAALFQDVSVRFLEERTQRALQRCQQDASESGQAMVTCLVVAGGVAANAKVRSCLQAVADRYKLPCIVPPARLCSDNGLMVAWTGVQRLKLGLCRAPPPAHATPEQVAAAVEVLPRWPLGPVDVRGMTKQNAKHCKMLH